MPLNGQQMAREVMAAIGGKSTKVRQKAFEKMCDAIVKHIQLNAVVTGITSPAVVGQPLTVTASKILPPGGGIS
jgi:hypothetical protein